MYCIAYGEVESGPHWCCGIAKEPQCRDPFGDVSEHVGETLSVIRCYGCYGCYFAEGVIP